jgi:FkbM family methyltransferase
MLGPINHISEFPKMLNTRRIVRAPADLRSRIAIETIGTCGELLRPLGHRGFWRACGLVGRYVIPMADTCIVQLTADSYFAFELGEPYWSRLIARSYKYETEIWRLLWALRASAVTFVDCGANLGYWSILASSSLGGGQEVIAIEASTRIFAALRYNQDLNGRRFRVLQGAVYSQSGKQLELEPGRGIGGAHLVGRTGEGSGEVEHVKSISLDDAYDNNRSSGDRPVVVKLDVEGVETEALEGAAGLLRRECLLIYEDHGRDRAHRATRFISGELGFSIYYVGGRGPARRIGCAADMERIKRSDQRGYNFFAAKHGSLLEERLIRLPASEEEP